MTRMTKGGRRPVLFWAVCPECLTYIWVDESKVVNEDTSTCPYCEMPISLIGGQELAEDCRRLQALIEKIDQQIATIPAAIDVHRFLFDQIDYISSTFNDRLDDIQAVKDLDGMGADIKTPAAS